MSSGLRPIVDIIERLIEDEFCIQVTEWSNEEFEWEIYRKRVWTEVDHQTIEGIVLSEAIEVPERDREGNWFVHYYREVIDRRGRIYRVRQESCRVIVIPRNRSRIIQESYNCKRRKLE